MSVRKISFLFVAGAVAVLAEPNPTEFFEARVRPILATSCYSCHTSSKLGGLQLDSREGLLQGGKSGPAMVPGKPAESLLIKAVSHADARLKMPVGGQKLSDQQIADLSRWIEMGAPWPEEKKVSRSASTRKGFVLTPEKRSFWSFQPVANPEVPGVRDKDWARTPIDRFVLAKLEANGLKPMKQADKRVLLRRATYDLIGLPPTPEEIDAFLKDSSSGAFAKVVDRLLASPHYGERWARHWLDVARYADGEGKPDEDIKTKSAKGARGMTFVGYGMTRDGYANTWRYRDWVIDAMNQDMPYDQFVKAQIAADLLPDAQQSKKLLPGLGLFGLGPWYTGDCVVYTEARADERDLKLDILSKGLLGLTVTCARCHDHKYDPISQKVFHSGGWRFHGCPL